MTLLQKLGHWMEGYVSPVRSAGGGEASVSGNSLHQPMVPCGAARFQIQVKRALRDGDTHTVQKTNRQTNMHKLKHKDK